MILVFGGTTEGRKAVKVLEEAGNVFYYSTKTGGQEVPLRHGIRIDGALNREAMLVFCREHDVQLLVDAAHPFAVELHKTVIAVAEELRVPVVRFERIYPPRDADIVWLNSYDDLHLPSSTTLLATTGVQTISRLKHLEAQGVRVVYRILQREQSVALAHQQGADDSQLCFYEDGGDERLLLEQLRPDAILLKESGLSGGFREKVEAARELGIRIYAVCRPSFRYDHIVDGEHGLRRMVEHLLPAFYPLHSGLTTGTCATAAAVAAALQFRALSSGAGNDVSTELPAEVPVVLPDGETIQVPVVYGDGFAAVIKASGDDPDVTDGLEIRVRLEPSDHVEICGGEGVGIITLPGFDFPPGSPAINRVPREMILRNLSLLSVPPFRVTISVPEGATVARRTFNPRLGIEGGISIIGVSGIVKPFSEEAFIDSIRRCMQIAKASGCGHVVINSGGKSERFVKACYPDLPRQAFVEYGNYIGETLRMAAEFGIPRVTLGVMLGKAVKLAEGHLDTHSRKATMNKAFIAEMLGEAGCEADIRGMTLARELWALLSPEQAKAFARVVIAHCAQHCRPLLPDGTLEILLIDDEGRIYSGEE